MDPSSSSSDREITCASGNSAPYRCIYCLWPCPSLYRIQRLGRGIQLCPCQHCGAVAVDAYCEREDLLVLLDCVLLRHNAYRHLLWNRYVAAADDDSASSENAESRKRVDNDASLTTFLRSLAICSILRAHICMVSTQDRVDIDHTLEAVIKFVQVAFISLIGIVAQLFVTSGLLQLIRWMQPLHSANEISCEVPTNKLLSSWATLLHSCLFRLDVVARSILAPAVGGFIATAALHLWENSNVVRRLGSILILLHQWITTTVVLETIIFLQSENRTFRSRLTSLVLLVSSLLIKSMVMMICWQAVSVNASHLGNMPCPGGHWDAGQFGKICFV